MYRYVIAALALAACAPTDTELRAAPPALQFTSAKHVDVLVACLVPSLSRHYAGAYGRQDRFSADVRSPGSEYDIVPTGQMVDGKYVFIVNVKSAGEGSVVSLYEPMAFGIAAYMKQGIADGVTACL